VAEATLRRFAINYLRAARHTNIAAALRDMSYEPFTRPLDLLKIGYQQRSKINDFAAALPVRMITVPCFSSQNRGRKA
jgi:hypothetical protein